MKYGLKIVYRIVAGDLNPSSEIPDQFEEHITYLKKYYAKCIRHIRIDFSMSPLQPSSIADFQDYGLLIKNHALQKESSLKNPELQDQLLNQAIQKLHISRNDIEESSVRTFRDHVSLEILIIQEINHLEKNQAKFYFYQVLLNRQIERIKYMLNEEIFKRCSEKEIRTYIHNYQSALENFSSLILSYLPEDERDNIYQLSINYTLCEIYKIIYQYLDELRVYIERHFTRYINVYAAIPYQSRLGHTLGIRKKIKRIYKKLLCTSIDLRLLNVLEIVLNRITNLLQQPGCTYKELLSYRCLLKELHSTFEQEGEVTTQTISDLLLRLNFNAVPFLNYLILRVEEELAKKQRTADKLALLYYYQKVYKQQISRMSTAFHTSLPTIQDQVVHWLKEEIVYYKKISKMDKQDKINKQEEKSSDELQEQPVKLKTSLSVAQIAYLMRVMYEAGIISNEHQREIARFVSESICTEKTSKISYESLYSKYYNVETCTHRAVKEVIIQMLNYVNKDK